MPQARLGGAHERAVLPVKVYDCFLFNDEVDLLELRMMELDHLVDVFVACELPVTFMREPKPLRLESSGKLRVVHPAVYPDVSHPGIEHFQRRQLAAGLGDAEPEDLILIGDVDEIPNPKWVVYCLRYPLPYPVTLIQRLYYYYVNAWQPTPWPGTVIMPRGTRKIDLEDVREKRFHFPKIQDGGWHFSWLGPLQAIQRKLRSIDVERDAQMHGTPEIRKPSAEDEAFLQACLDTGADLFGRDTFSTRKQLVPIEPGRLQPWKIWEWLERHPEYEWKQ
jgi:beta-1,4-mannosyl-glycoprotein beta-1,4-N-acetylglucosaminyltransferase